MVPSKVSLDSDGGTIISLGTINTDNLAEGLELEAVLLSTASITQLYIASGFIEIEPQVSDLGALSM